MPEPPRPAYPGDWLTGHAALCAARAAAAADLDQRLERARRLIDRRFAEPLDLERIAAEACLSRYHFLREFRRAYGDPPHRYLIRRRILHARELLTTTRLSVTEICLDVGFQSLGSFSTLFRRHVGRSPFDFRARRVQIGRLALVHPERAVPSCFRAAYLLVDGP